MEGNSATAAILAPKRCEFMKCSVELTTHKKEYFGVPLNLVTYLTWVRAVNRRLHVHKFFFFFAMIMQA